MHEQPGILVGIRPLNFTSRDTGELVKGVKIILLKPCVDPVRDGYGYVPFDLTDLSEDGLRRAGALAESSKQFFLQDVLVSCEIDASFKRPRFLPRSIRLV